MPSTQKRMRRATLTAEETKRLLLIQEKQIEALQRENAAYEAIITGLAYLSIDVVDTQTGEVVKRPLFDSAGGA